MRQVYSVTDTLLDLILPLQCGGCGAPSARWCDACAAVLHVNSDEPHVISPRLDPGVPVFALGPYAGPRRQALVAFKEHGRRDLVGPLSRALAVGIHRLTTWGILDHQLTVVPAPTRRAAARRRGGDPVARIAAAAIAASPHHGLATVLRTGGLTTALRTGGPARDSVGLSTAARERNIAGRVRLTGPVPDGEILLVDDILSTGATAREGVRVLAAGGGRVGAVLTLAH